MFLGRFTDKTSFIMRNVEIKAKVNNLADLIAKATLLSDTPEVVIKQHDTFFKTNAGRLKMRVFEDDTCELIYYDRPNSTGPKLCNFEKSLFPAGTNQGLKNVLAKALGISGVVKKSRKLFMIGQTRVHVDKVEDLGDFMELEVVLRPEQSLEEGQKIADEIMEKLGVSNDDLIPVAYTDLILAKSD